MADDGVRLGGAWYDVSLRFNEFEKGLKEAERKLRGSAEKIEESFMVKYTKGFTEKFSGAATERAMAGQFAATQRYAKEDAENAQKKIAAERAYQSQLKANSAASKLLADADKNRLAIMLGINDALDTQIAKQTQATAASKGGILGRIMGNMGVKTNQMGMMGAQLSYAAQDFVTGLSMGNLNMAILGASNNLGMMAMQVSSAAAAWTTLGLVAIPMVITAIKAFAGEEDKAKQRAEELNRIYERRNFILGLQVKENDRLTDAEVRRMHGAGNLGGRVFGEEQGLQKINIEMDKRIAKAGEIQETLKGEVVGEINVENTKKRIADIDAALLKVPAGNEKQMDRLNAERNALADDLNFLKLYNDERKKMALRGEKETMPGIIADRFGVEAAKVESTKGGGIVVRKKVDEADRKKHEAELTQANKTIEELKVDRENSISNREKLRKRFEDEARTELEFQQREQKARFNQYEHRKIELDRQEHDERREIKETFGQISAGKRMTEEEYRKRQDEIDDKAVQDSQSTIDRMVASRDQKMHHNKRLTDKEVEGFQAELAEVENNRQKSQKELDKQFKEGPGTLADPMLAANKAKFQRQRIELAEEFANKGPRGHFTGIEQLAKDVQQGMNTGKHIDLAAQTADNTKGTMQAVQDLARAVANMNMGVGP